MRPRIFSTPTLSVPAICALAALVGPGAVASAEPGLKDAAPPPWGSIHTVAGNGDLGFYGDSGPATDARLLYPKGVAPTPDGGFLIADEENHRIRKVDSAGTIRTVAGSSARGFFGEGGPATAAALNHPLDAAPTADGGFLVADEYNHRIRKVNSAGTIRTVAGSGPASGWGFFSGDGGPATAARLSEPRGVAATPDGGFLIADKYNHRIRKVDSAGTIRTVAGSGPVAGPLYGGGFSGDGGPATAARLSFPYGVAPTPDGGFLIADTGNRRIRHVSPDGTITTVAGGGDGPISDGVPATETQLRAPTGVAPLSDGGFLIADIFDNRIRYVSPEGTITTAAGRGGEGSFSGDRGPATEARLDRPADVAPTPDGGFLIADEFNARIRYVGTIPPESPRMTLEPGSWSFGEQRLRTTSYTKWFQVRNNTSSELRVTGASIPSGNPDEFPPFSMCAVSGPVSPGGSCGVSVSFSPARLGPREGTLRVDYEGPPGAGSVTARLGGIGTGETWVEHSPGTPEIVGPLPGDPPRWERSPRW